MISPSKPLALDTPEAPPWFIRSRRAWNLSVPIALLLLSAACRGTGRYAALGTAQVLVGQFIRCWAAGCIRKNRDLATDGPFAWTRNPLYFGSFIIALGYVVLSGVWPTLIVVPVLFAAIYLPTMRLEETQLRRLFGASADDYCRAVPSFFPRVPRWRRSIGSFCWRRLASNREWDTAIANAIGVALFWLT